MALNPKNCKPGQEQHEFFNLPNMNRRRKNPSKMVQYDYRHHDGELFSCVAGSLESARAKKQDWLNVKIVREAKEILK